MNLITLCNQTFLLSFACVSLWVFFLILLAGDIESNPGPDMLDHSSDYNISNSSTYDISIFEQNFSIVQYNIQSLMGKVDQLQIELSYFDVIALTET